ncbi:MAG: hypothetical protein ACREMX_01715 [Gemmatimonadales bacterium]
MSKGKSIEALALEAVGLEKDDVSRPELNRLVREFVAAGRDAVRTSIASPLAAARILVRTSDRLSRARQRLGESTRPGHRPMIVDDSWRALEHALLRHRDRLLRYPGAIGLTMGHRRHDGRETGQRCITVFVRKKWSRSALERRGWPALPRFVRVRDGGRVRVDVEELGPVELQAMAGSSIGPRNDSAEGTLGAFGRDRASGRSVAFTAMHVAGETLRNFPAPGVPPIDFVSPALSSIPFGTLLRGTRRGVDAAAILLTPASQAQDPAPFGPVKGWRPLSFPGDIGTAAKLWGARTGFATGVVTEPGVFLGPEYPIDFAIIADIPTRGGDSGAALLDSDNWVLGFLHGAAPRKGPNARVFVPASVFLDRLQCDLP